MQPVKISVLLAVLLACSAPDDQTEAPDNQPISDKNDPTYALPKVGLTLELPPGFRIVTTANVDSLLTVLQGLRHLRNPCTGTLTSLESVASNESMEMLVAERDPVKSIVIGAHPRSNLSPEQASVVVQNLCGRMHRGISMKFISDSTGTSRLGTFYSARFAIDGPTGAYPTELFIVTSQLRTYTFAFNGAVVENPVTVLDAATESTISISPQALASFIQSVNPGYDKQLLDSAAHYLYAARVDTIVSKPGVVTMPGSCSFYLPYELEIQSSSYQNYVRATTAMLNKEASAPGTFWVQQRGVNIGDKAAMATYFRFSVEATVLSDGSVSAGGLSQLSNQDLVEMNETYKQGINEELLPNQKIEQFDAPSRVKIGMYDGVRFGLVRTTDGKKTAASRTIVFEGGKLYAITLSYRKDDEARWLPVAGSVLNSLLLL